MSTPQQAQDDVLSDIRTAFAAARVSYPSASDLARFSRHDLATVEQALRDLEAVGKIKLARSAGQAQKVTWVA